MFHDHVNEEHTDQNVVYVKICITGVKQAVVEHISCSDPAVAVSYDLIDKAVEYRKDEHPQHDMALFFSSRQVPASRDQNDQKNSDADKIGNQYRMQIDYGRKQCVHTKNYTILAR